MNARAALALSACLLACLSGCVERRIEITSEPSGARVWVNDQQVGRTPTVAEFLYHGVYDVRLELEGHEPLLTEAEATPPIYEHAPLDLAAEALPVDFENVQRWHFVLEPSLERVQAQETFRAGLLDRAAAMRADMGEVPPEASSPEDPDAAENASGDSESGDGPVEEAPSDRG